jgi:uncharacterized membrane protein YidH (DUF202 family)
METFADPRRADEWQEPLARVGLVAKGISYGLVGLLALKLALGDGGAATSNQGAMQHLASTSFGAFLLVLLAIGLAAYALWRLIQAWKGTERFVNAARVLIYGALTYSAVRILTGSGEQSQNRSAHKTTAAVLGWPGGTWIVGAIGAVLIGIGLYQLYMGVSRKFEEKWRGQSDIGNVVGVVGHIARFVVLALIGIFAIKAAVDYNPQKAVGLDGALQKLVHESYGSFLLGVTAAGLIAYAVFCFFDARYRDPYR